MELLSQPAVKGSSELIAPEQLGRVVAREFRQKLDVTLKRLISGKPDGRNDVVDGWSRVERTLTVVYREKVPQDSNETSAV
jgi:hypothetical protein